MMWEGQVVSLGSGNSPEVVVMRVYRECAGGDRKIVKEGEVTSKGGW
jgi:hypothetical protein